jgi:hypothetical protein
MGKAMRLYTKEIRGDQSDRGDRSSSVLISMIMVLAESSGPRICQGVWSPTDGHHHKLRQASAVTLSPL